MDNIVTVQTYNLSSSPNSPMTEEKVESVYSSVRCFPKISVRGSVVTLTISDYNKLINILPF